MRQWLSLLATLSVLAAACHEDLGVGDKTFACSSSGDCLDGCECLAVKDKPYDGVCLCGSGDDCWVSLCPQGFGPFDGCRCRVPPTGVSACFDGTEMAKCASVKGSSPYVGQDGHTPSTPDPLVNLGDRTVLDERTGLVWARDPVLYQRQPEAVAVCQDNPDGLPGQGWRLPDLMELLSLLDYSMPGCPLWHTAFGAQCPDDTWFWASTVTPHGAFKVGFDCGEVHLADIGAEDSVYTARCVRGGEEDFAKMPGAPRFEPDGNGAVIDRVAGLVWARTIEIQEADWPGALHACTARGPGWRLPDAKELLSLVDQARAECPVLYDVFQVPCPPETLWASTPDPDGPGYAYRMNVLDGWMQSEDVTVPHAALCVRSLE